MVWVFLTLSLELETSVERFMSLKRGSFVDPSDQPFFRFHGTQLRSEKVRKLPSTAAHFPPRIEHQLQVAKSHSWNQMDRKVSSILSSNRQPSQICSDIVQFTHDHFVSLRRLSTLNISFNQLRKLPELPPQLKILDISFNKIDNLTVSSLSPPPFHPFLQFQKPLKHLQSLKASNNLLDSVPDNIVEFSSLQNLQLNDNKLCSLPNLDNVSFLKTTSGVWYLNKCSLDISFSSSSSNASTSGTTVSLDFRVFGEE